MLLAFTLATGYAHNSLRRKLKWPQRYRKYTMAKGKYWPLTCPFARTAHSISWASERLQHKEVLNHSAMQVIFSRRLVTKSQHILFHVSDDPLKHKKYDEAFP